jgi:hypothetical protein
MLRERSLNGRKGRAARPARGVPVDPCTEPCGVEHYRCQVALQVCFGEFKLTGLAQATASDAPCVPSTPARAAYRYRNSSVVW